MNRPGKSWTHRLFGETPLLDRYVANPISYKYSLGDIYYYKTFFYDAVKKAQRYALRETENFVNYMQLILFADSAAQDETPMETVDNRRLDVSP